MEQLSRRDFLKISGVALGTVLIPGAGVEAQEEVPPPMMYLPTLWTHDTPVKVHFLRRNGIGYSWQPTDWRNISEIPLDVLTPIRTVHYTHLEEYSGEVLDEYAYVSQLPHITGSPAEWEVIVGWGKRDSMQRLNGNLEGKWGGLISTYCYAEQRDLYANKIWNILTALESIADWVRDNGPLRFGRDYSMLEMSRLIEDIEIRHLYRDGLSSMGGGVCSVASTLSKCVLLATARGYTEEVSRNWHLPEYRYWAPPIEPGITRENSDATVCYYRRDARPFDPDNLDYIFRLTHGSSPLFLSVKAHLACDEEPRWGDLTLNTDARLTYAITLKLTENNGDEGRTISDLKRAYVDFHHFQD